MKRVCPGEAGGSSVRSCSPHPSAEAAAVVVLRGAVRTKPCRVGRRTFHSVIRAPQHLVTRSFTPEEPGLLSVREPHVWRCLETYPNSAVLQKVMW